MRLKSKDKGAVGRTGEEEGKADDRALAERSTKVSREVGRVREGGLDLRLRFTIQRRYCNRKYEILLGVIDGIYRANSAGDTGGVLHTIS